MKGRRAGRGFTVLELVITLLVAALVLAVAAQLLAAAGRRLVIEERRALEMSVEVALAQLRADVQAAIDTTGTGGGDLTLRLPGGGFVVWRWDGDRLHRTLTSPPGERPVLSGVRGFSWVRLAGPGPLQLLPDASKPVVRIVLAVERTRRSGPQAVDGLRLAVPRGVEHRELVITLRGGGGVGW